MSFKEKKLMRTINCYSTQDLKNENQTCAKHTNIPTR